MGFSRVAPLLRRVRMERMAAVESLGSANPIDAVQWLIVRGTLRADDLVSLLDRATAGKPADVALDLLSLDQLSAGGCWTIRNLAEHLWREGRLLTVLYHPDGIIADALHAGGTIQHPHIAFRPTPIT